MNPFPGLRPFEADEAHLFFGRETQVERVLEKLRDLGFVAVVGPSGSGKSSLVRAGLLPALHRDFVRSWRVAILRPGSHPIANLATALVEAGGLASEADEDADVGLETTLRRGARGLEELLSNARRTGRFGEADRLLILVDQFEELFRYREIGHEGVAEAAGFVKLLVAGAQAGAAILLTMRSDFLGDCGQFPELAEAVDRGQHLIPRMSREERRRAIEGPVQVAGGRLEPSLTARLLNEAGDDPDALPLLQHALMVLWDLREGDLRLADFEALGGLAPALSSHLDRILEELPPEERRIAERLFRRLTELGSEGRERRAPARYAELVDLAGRPEAEVREVVEAFRRPGRSFLMPPAEVDLEPETVVDISHESLIRGWRTLGDWVQEERESADTLRRLTEDAWLWRQGRKGLLRDPELAVLERWRDEQAPRETWAARYLQKGEGEGSLEEGLAYLEESRLARDREAEEADRRRHEREEALERAAAAAEAARQAQEAAADEARRSAEAQAALADTARRGEEEGRRTAERFRRTASLLVVALGLAITVALVSVWANYEAKQQQRAAQAALAQAERALAMNTGETARHLATEAQAALQDRLPQRALLLAAASVDLGGPQGPPESWTVLRRVLGIPAGAPGPVFGSAILGVAARGNLLAFGCEDGSVHLVSRRGAETRTLMGHHDAVFGIALSPDGKWLATGSRDGTTRLWDLTREKPTGQVVGKHGNTAYRVAFSPDGRFLVSANLDQTFTLQEVARPEASLRRFDQHDEMVQAAVFSADGEQLATGSLDGQIRTWWVADDGTLTPNQVLETPYEAVDSLAFSRDGFRLAVGGSLGNVRLFTLGGKEPIYLNGHTENVTAVLFTTDGRHLATVSFDRTLRLWDLERPERLPRVYTGHDGSVWDVAQVEEFLITGAQDGTSRTWDLGAGRNVPGLEVQESPDGDLKSVGLSEDGARMVTGSWNGQARLWDLKAGTSRLLGSEAARAGASASLDRSGRRVAWNQGQALFVQDLDRPGARPRRVGQHDAPVVSVALSPEGKDLVTTALDGTVGLWRLDSPLGNRRFRLGSEPAHAVFSPDGKRIAASMGDSTVRILNLGDPDPAATNRVLRGHEINVFEASFSPDGRYLASCSPDRTVRVWDLEAPGLPTQIQRVEHDDIVASVAWSPDGRSLASGAWDGSVRIWDVASPAAARTLQNERVQTVSFSPDGKQLVVLAGDASVRWWGLDAQDLPSAARTMAGRDFSRDEFVAMALDLWAERDLQDGKTGSPAAAAYLAEKLRLSEEADSVARQAIAALSSAHLDPDAQAALLLAQAEPPDLARVSPLVLKALAERVLELPLAEEAAQDLGSQAAAALVQRAPDDAEAVTLLRKVYLRRGQLKRARTLLEEGAGGLPSLLAEARHLRVLPGVGEEPLASWRRAVLARLRQVKPESVLSPEALEAIDD